MMRFTDSPYERFMTQVPAGRTGIPPPPVRPPGHPCKGCPYDNGSPCIGVCLRELLRGQR